MGKLRIIDLIIIFCFKKILHPFRLKNCKINVFAILFCCLMAVISSRLIYFHQLHLFIIFYYFPQILPLQPSAHIHTNHTKLTRMTINHTSPPPPHLAHSHTNILPLPSIRQIALKSPHFNQVQLHTQQSQHPKQHNKYHREQLLMTGGDDRSGVGDISGNLGTSSSRMLLSTSHLFISPQFLRASDTRHGQSGTSLNRWMGSVQWTCGDCE
jgi:hypothetical protein